MHWIDTVASYLPSLIVNHLINRTTNEELPSRQEYDTVCLFADVSGFTALSEAMMTSSEGVEGLAKHLNSYFGQMVRIIASEGGDVFKFAGDALIVLWPPPTRDSLTDVSVKRGREGDSGELEGTTPMERRVRRAAQCAFATQDALHNCELAQEVRLSVKIGIGMGKVSVLHLGGVYKRMEYIAVGEPLLEAFTAEHHATPGDVIISAQAHKLVKGHFTTTELFSDNYCRVVKEPRYTPMRKQNKVNMLQQSLDDPLLEVKVKGYIPGAVLRNLRPDSPEDEHWSNEIRRVTVLFVNLGLKEQTLLAAAVYDEAMKEMHRVMVAVQESVYEYEGSINKFLMDDKGSTLVAVYGLPPVGHADDPTRGVLAALRLCERLFDLAKVGSVGITTGEAFCGVVGSKTRKEYTVLGDSVNLAARLMQRALSEDGGVLCELATKRACGGLLQFKARGDFRIKGKTAAAKVFQPYPEDFPKPQPPQYLGANVYGLIHNQQRQNYVMHKLLTSLQAYFARPSVKEAKENSFSGQTSAVSSPTGEQRGRRLSGAGRSSGYSASRMSRTESAPEDEDDEDVGENTLLGMGDNFGDGSEEDDDPDVVIIDGEIEDAIDHHVELQEPSYAANVMHRPFHTGPLPLGLPLMDADDPYHVVTRSDLGPLESGAENGVDPAIQHETAPRQQAFRKRTIDRSLSGDVLEAAQAASAAAGDPDVAGAVAGASIPSQLPASSPDAPAGVSRLEYIGKSECSRYLFGVDESEAATASGTGLVESEARAAAAALVAGVSGKEPVQKQKSDRLTAKIFENKPGSAAGIAKPSAPPSAYSSGAEYASPEVLSPTSTATDSLPARGMSGRRQGDSRLKKVFRTHVADESASPQSATKGSPKAAGGRGAGHTASSTSASGSTSASELTARTVAQSAPSIGNGGIGGSGHGGGSRAATVMPSSMVRRSGDGGSGSSGSNAAGGGWFPRKGRHQDGSGSSKDAKNSAPLAEEEKGEPEGIVPEPPVPSDTKEPPSPAFASANRDNFAREISGGVAVDDDGVYPTAAVGQKRRASRQRLSIAQNGMVPLPASAGIPQWESGSSGSCSLPRYSRYSGQQLIGGGSSGGMHGQSTVQAAFQPNGRSISSQGPNHGTGQTLYVPPPPIPSTFGPSGQLVAAFGSVGTRNGPRRLDDSASSTTSSNGGGGMRMMHPPVSSDGFEDWRLQVVVPRGWKWSSLPTHCHRLPAILARDVSTFQALLDRCWSDACSDAEVMGWSQPPPAREDLVLNILGTRVVLPTDPDYEVVLLPAFIKEACGTRGFRGFMDRKRSFPPDSWSGGGNGAVELCLVPRREILNVQSRWLNSRICLLQHKIALISTQMGSVVLLEGLPGAGKTEVLSVFAARTLPRTALIHFTAASPYSANKAFGGWSMVLQQYLDSLYKQEVQAGRENPSVQGSGHGAVGGARSSGVGGNEAANGASILGHRPLASRDRMLLSELRGFPEMEAYAFLVNDVLGTEIPSKGTLPTWDADSSTSGSAFGDGANSNESDGSDFEESSSVGHQQRLRLRILLQLVKNMARSKPRVIIIDDAQFLDKDSWTLALAVATGGPMGTPLPLMLILSLRPLVHYRAIFAHIPPDYKALTELEHVHFVKIEGAPPEEVEDLVSEKLGTNVVDISDSLFGLVEELCNGNPLMITELVSHLKMVEPRQLRYSEIRSEEGDQGGSQNNIDVAVHVGLTESYRLRGTLLPDKINALLTSQTDRLNSCQLMALKVASLIGQAFSTWFLYRVYPINGHKDRLLRELAALEEQGFLVEVQGKEAENVIKFEGSGRPTAAQAQAQAQAQTQSREQSGNGGGASHSRSNSTGSTSQSSNVVYKFTHGFMIEMLQLKMLKSQKSFLKDRIQKLKDSLETQRRHEDLMKETIDNSCTYKDGTLSVMKYKVTMSQAATNARETTRRRKDSITSRAMRRVKQPMQQKWGEAVDWKKRKCLLTGESLSLFSDPRDVEPSQIVYLQGATAEAELGEAFKDAAFRVETSKWKKGDELVDVKDGGERRTFTFLAENKEEKELWLYQLRHCIEVIEVHARKSGTDLIDRFSRMNSARFGATDSRPTENMDDVDSMLVVRVEEADDLILEEIYGTTYPYCIVDLDDQGRRTNSVQAASVNPSWHQELTFPVSIQQWILSNLRIQVWNHDLFLTDDFLGRVTIPLSEVPVQEWDQDKETPPSEPKWYKMESRCRAKHTSGRLLLGVQLFMTKRTTARAAGVGGVDSLKAIAERRMDISSRAARVGQIQQRKLSLPGLVHHVQSGDPHAHHHHHHHHHPGMMPPPMPQGFSRGVSTSGTNLDSSIRASIRSMQVELESSGRKCSRVISESGHSLRADGVPAGVRQESGSSHYSIDGAEDDGGSGPGGEAGNGTVVSGRTGGRHRRRITGGRHRSKRAASDSSSHGGVSGLGATEVLHTDPLTRQLHLMLLAVETKAEVSAPEEGGGGSVNRDWIRAKLKEMLTMVGRGDTELDQLNMHTYYCKDRKENVYGPFPAKQLVEAHNAGYINDRKVLVKEARMRGEFRPMGARALMHGPSSDEAFKSLTMWPQADAHHPLADKILSPGDGRLKDTSKDFRQWSFDIFGLETEELGMLAATVLADTGLPRAFGISMKTFAHFMSAVGFFMGRNPRVSYHNLYHAVDVMHATYLALDGMGASGLLTETEELALILSALCHDLDHPGLTNSFQTATESPLASLYNDQAPLEHHHLAITFQILRREGCDILGHLEKPLRDRIRKVMVQGILATEMSEHGTHIKKIDKLMQDYPIIDTRITAWASGEIGRGSYRTGPFPSSPPLHTENCAQPPPLSTVGSAAAAAAATPGKRRKEGRGVAVGSRMLQVPGAEADALGFDENDRLTVASALLHAADLSSPGRPWGTCKMWVERLLEEFKFQAEQERQRGLRVTVLEGSPSSSQPGFIDAFLLPFFTAMLPMAPGLGDEYLPNLRTNRDNWQSIAKEEEATRSAPQESPAGAAGKPADRNSTGSIYGAAIGRGSVLIGASDHDTGRPLSATFGADRRYSGGTIGIASMLGSLGTVSSGRMDSDYGRRVSSILSSPGASFDGAVVGLGPAGAYGRQASNGSASSINALVGHVAEEKWAGVQTTAGSESAAPAAASSGGGSVATNWVREANKEAVEAFPE